MVIAEKQKKGKGRLNRKWFSPIGGIWLSIILRPKIAVKNAPILTLVAGTSVARTLKQLYNIDAKVKWPNDVLIDNKKVCGILTEMNSSNGNINYIVVGIGINANIDSSFFPNHIKKAAISLKDVLGKNISREEFIKRLLGEFEVLYEMFTTEQDVLKLWIEISDTIGRYVRVISIDEDVEGFAVGIDHDGALLLKKHNGIKRIRAGDCIYLR